MSVDMYKYATYGEINPAIFQVVTFPFLFSIMYGDYGHGAVFFLIGLILVLFESCLKNNATLKPILQVRYFIMMMGFFACYNGLIYNEFFAVPNNWFGTCFDTELFDKENEAAGKESARRFDI